MIYQKIDEKNRINVNQFILKQWLSSEMVIRGTIIDMTKVEGYIALENNTIVGLITFVIDNEECEILSLDSLQENTGLGTNLLQIVINHARESNCKRVKLITTNDNIRAIQFYQKRGFDICNIYYNALDISRKIKPEIPMIGENGIPLKHEIEFVLECCMKRYNK